MHTSAQPLLSQILPPSPTTLASPPPPSLSTPPPIPPFISNSGEPTEKVRCHLSISPSTMVIRFGDPVTANCSVSRMDFFALGWAVKLGATLSMGPFVVWSVDKMTEWNEKPSCFALSEQGGPCHINLTLTVYKPPDSVSISFVNHTGAMFEGHQYTLQCTVQDVAPVEKLVVTFYRGQTSLGQPQSNNNIEKKPVNESFSLNITPSKEDDGVQFWCEAKLELGPDGPQRPPVVTSEKLTATVLFGPQLVCPTKLWVREGENLCCEVRGNPPPLVTWFRDGQVVALPTNSSRKDAGKYTVSANGLFGQKNFTVEVEFLAGSGTTISCNRHFLLAGLLMQMINCL
ncbi:hypothetical protein PFLUV_G00004060 [Perca fluviatilis]|uniref:Ig-like domain-containing protein n=2 Tax=Perca fluviatilis TaxID=8168 RepID=A0A6A5FLQ5_PERFL|nr:hypothetical protein PFLUV_G00004060 [Perca fluviatilis]